MIQSPGLVLPEAWKPSLACVKFTSIAGEGPHGPEPRPRDAGSMEVFDRVVAKRVEFVFIHRRPLVGPGLKT